MALVSKDDGPWDVIVVDVQGTIAHADNSPILNAIEWVNQNAFDGAEVIIWSGHGKAIAEGIAKKVGVFYDHVYCKSDLSELMGHIGDRSCVFVDDQWAMYLDFADVINATTIRSAQ